MSLYGIKLEVFLSNDNKLDQTITFGAFVVCVCVVFVVLLLFFLCFHSICLSHFGYALVHHRLYENLVQEMD